MHNFNFEIVELIKIDKDIIDYKKVIQEREEYYILAYNSNNNYFGYNKRIKCETNLGIKFSEETKQKLSESHMGHKRSKEAHEKIIASQYKEVYKIDKFGRIVEGYHSLKDAAEKNNLHRSLISEIGRAHV